MAVSKKPLTIYVLAVADEKEVDSLRVDPAKFNSIVTVNPKTPHLFTVWFQFFGLKRWVKWVCLEKPGLHACFPADGFSMFQVKPPKSIGNRYLDHEQLFFQIF